jgi:predicted nucleic acid-binding protein
VSDITNALLDTNALLYILKTGKYEKLRKENCHILDLTLYECGNAILNLFSKRSEQLITLEKANILLSAVERIAGRLTIQTMLPGSMPAIFKLAKKESISFYDSCYLYSCLHFDLFLITEDERLARAALNNSIKTMNSSQWTEI